MPDHDIHQRLEALTTRLYRLVDEKNGNLVDPGVIAVSQEMDGLIVSIQRAQLRARQQDSVSVRLA
ncbi:Spo0E family sporulation regulatory protein-aspartic acid phosphatase [Paenibacillus mesotrionivorans]|uniref:Spo0E family sporulation regulatory protein-aspartic acid phosphatase n=1 Tax=Paenibacillus mesotrionivorans TaxID=3160968 RepID=A0ACC7NXZ9_9BACL